MINKERVKFKLRHSTKPTGRYFISGLVKVVDLLGGGEATITFSRDFARYVGTELPFGLGEDRMAFIQVVQVSKCQWVVLANYIDNSTAAILWVADTKPAWLTIKRSKTNDKTAGTGEVHERDSKTCRAALRDGRIASS